jgi:hypothetical protein
LKISDNGLKNGVIGVIKFCKKCKFPSAFKIVKLQTGFYIFSQLMKPFGLNLLKSRSDDNTCKERAKKQLESRITIATSLKNKVGKFNVRYFFL